MISHLKVWRDEGQQGWQSEPAEHTVFFDSQHIAEVANVNISSHGRNNVLRYLDTSAQHGS